MQILGRHLLPPGISGLAALLATVLGLGFLTPPLALSAPAAQDPATVVAAYVAAVNAGNADGAAATFSENATDVHAPARGSCSRQSPCIGRPAILADLRARIALHDCFTIVEQTVQGSVVLSRVEVWNDDIRANGVDRIVNQWMTLVDQGRIAARYAVPDLSDPQTAANAAIGAGTQAPGAALPISPCG